MRVIIRGDSMTPVLVAGQELYVSRIAYRIGRPSRGDLVVLRREEGPLLIKRVVAEPRDRVALSSGLLQLNGFPEAREDPRSVEPRPPDFEQTLGPDEYFVLGEDPGSSWDSRRFGPVRRTEILGKVIGCYWPPARWGFIGRSRSSRRRFARGRGTEESAE